jgi:hypothetical protein
MPTASDRSGVFCVGTSPAMLFRGLRLAAEGRDVTFVDSADRIGGGWRTADVLGCKGVELGVHLFENRERSNRALLKVLGPDGLCVDEAGFGLVRDRRIPLRPARTLLYSGLLAKALVRRDREDATHSASNLAGSLRGLRRALVYPARGVRDLLTRIEARLVDLGVRFLFDRKIASIDAGGRNSVLHLASGETLVGETAVFSSRAHAPVLGFERHWRDLETRTISNLVMKFAGDPLLFEGYVEIFGHSVLKRVRRLSPIGLPADQSMFVCQLRLGIAQSPRMIDIATESLVRLKLLQPSAVTLGHHLDHAVYTTLPSARAKHICARAEGRLAFVRSVDFSDERHIA